MTWADAIIIVVISALLSFAVYKIVKAKKSGSKCTACLGCPYSSDCSKVKK